MIKHYTIEEMDSNGRWSIIGQNDSSADAQSYMRRYRGMFPECAFRVVENPSRKLIVCEGGQAD